MRKVIVLLIASVFIFACTTKNGKQKPGNAEKFSFVFMTDIHVCTERNADLGLQQAIDTINKLAPDFVITGGDNIMDALGQTQGRADSLYQLYTDIMKNLQMPVHHGMGNHEVFGLYIESGVDPSHEFYGKKMFENRLAKPYYSFDEKNWHFIMLDPIGFTEDRRYFGHIDSVQVEWLKADLAAIGTEKPVVVVTHIPLVSIGSQIMEGPTEPLSKGSVVTNANDIRKILEHYNVKLVLQGHLHFLEDIEYHGIHYITGGAVSSQWWQGPRYGMEEGFVKVDITGENFDWQYVDFGWEVK
jgi:3',5'-cyclic AMP phosphodiesterase CpdA